MSACAPQQDDVDVRRSAVNLLGQLFTGSAELCGQYHKNFTEFLQRFHDKEVNIRAAMVQFSGKLLQFPPVVSQPVAAELKRRITDLDAGVRLAAVTTVADVACSAIDRVPADLLFEALCRVHDKKVRCVELLCMDCDGS